MPQFTLQEHADNASKRLGRSVRVKQAQELPDGRLIKLSDGIAIRSYDDGTIESG